MTDHPPDLPLAVPLDGSAGELENTFRRRAAMRVNAIRLLPRAGFGLVTVLALVYLALGLLPVLFVILTSAMIGKIPAVVAAGLGSGPWRSLFDVFAGVAGVFAATQILAPIATSLTTLLALQIDRSVYDELLVASLESSDVVALEDPAIQDKLRVAGLKLEFAVVSPGAGSGGMLALIARYVQVIGFATVVGVRFAWWAGLGIAVAVLLARHGMRGGLSAYADARRRLARAERKADYLRNLALMPPASKEIRVFGLAEWLLRAYREVYLMWAFRLWAVRRRTQVKGFLAYAVWGMVLAAAIFSLMGARAASTMSLTTFALVAQAALGAMRQTGYYPEADLQTAIGAAGYHEVRRCTRAIRKRDAKSVAGTRPVPEISTAIKFDRVSFAYPGESRRVFDGLELTLQAGQCTAIVGANGSGKTTLVKLLARLYEPDDGAVRLDGLDITSFPVEQWRAKAAVIFQDFLRYEISAADNIGFGAIRSIEDREGIMAAASAAGLDDLIGSLPQGIDTPLARHLTGGTELSGGQWQRIALARALFATRHGASIVVLDEPTASLDMRAEAMFFDQFAELTRGITTLLISHRFSTVRHADHIVVLDRGRVAEQGSHDELIDRDGKYARLFRLQRDLLTAPQRPRA